MLSSKEIEAIKIQEQTDRSNFIKYKELKKKFKL